MIKYLQALALAIVLFAASCVSPKKSIYFNTRAANDTVKDFANVLPRPEVVLKSDDIVAINVSSIDAFTQKDPVAIFNEGGIAYALSAQGIGGNVGNTGGQQIMKGYLIDVEGNIDFPVVGKVKFAGLSLAYAKDTLAQRLKNYIKDPVVEVRIINYKVNMLGEVGRVGPVVAPNHKMNIMEAITAAGDIPITGRRDNILIVREKEGKLEFGRINLNSKNVFTSPYYYLQQNDIVYVEPNRIKRQEQNEFLRFYLPTIASMLGTFFSIYGIVQLSK